MPIFSIINIATSFVYFFILCKKQRLWYNLSYLSFIGNIVKPTHLSDEPQII